MTKMTRLRRQCLRASVAFAALSTAAIIADAPAGAQSYSSVRATGAVLDQDGKPIADAVVSVKSEGQGFSRTVNTGSDGLYSIPELPLGNYTFTVTAPGYAPYSESGIRLTPESASSKFNLVAKSATDTPSDIVVQGKRTATADFDRTTVGLVIDLADEVKRVPIARNLQSVIQLAPGANSGSSAFGGLSSINGSAVSENAFFVNGLNITDFRKGLSPVEVPYDFYQTVEAKTGGYAAEYGRSTGGSSMRPRSRGATNFTDSS